MSDIFAGQGTPPESQPAGAPELDTLLDSIKNEQGQRKYANVQEALKALQHSQEFIPTLKTKLTEQEERLKQLEEEASRAARLEELVQQLTTQKPPAPSQGDTPPVQGLDEKTVVELVKQTLGQTEQQRVESQNEEAVKQSLLSTYGDKSVDVVTAKAVELGLSTEDLRQLSRKSPALVLELFKTKPTQSSSRVGSSVVVPPINDNKPEIKRPDKSVLIGATTKEQVAHLNDIRAAIYAKHGITQ